jgi:hypothetical protein
MPDEQKWKIFQGEREESKPLLICDLINAPRETARHVLI